MKMTIESAKAVQVETQAGGGFRSMLTFDSNKNQVWITLPMKLEVGEEYRIRLEVEQHISR